MIFVSGAQKHIPAAYELKTYAGLSNRVDINDDQGARIAYIRPPMWFFQFANQIARADLDRLGFFLEKVDKRWVFGVDDLDSDWTMDFLSYSRSELPYWATRDYQRDLREGTEPRVG